MLVPSSGVRSSVLIKWEHGSVQGQVGPQGRALLSLGRKVKRQAVEVGTCACVCVRARVCVCVAGVGRTEHSECQS